MRNRLQRFMTGRYGMDSYSRFLLIISIISGVCSLFFGRISKFFYMAAVLLLVYVYYRMFSKNYEKRYKENLRYLDIFNRIKAAFRRQKSVWEQRKTHHVYTCPSCKQKIRVPKGKGKIVVTCPKCRTEFQKKS